MDSEIQLSKLRMRDTWLSVYMKVLGLLVVKKHNTSQHWCGCQKKFQFAVVLTNKSLSKMKAWIFFFFLLDSVFFRTHLLCVVLGYYFLRGLWTNWYTCREERGEDDKGNWSQVIWGVVKAAGVFSLVKRWLMVGLTERS